MVISNVDVDGNSSNNNNNINTSLTSATSSIAKSQGGSEDWMRVLDNFLDKDVMAESEDGNHQASGGHTSTTPKSYPSPVVVGPQPSHDPIPIPETLSTGVAATVAVPLVAGAPSTTDQKAQAQQQHHHQQQQEAEAEEDDENQSEEAKAIARSVRKRHREKQRRSDVNSQFTSLTALLGKIEAEYAESDSEDEEECDDGRRKRAKTVGLLGFKGLTQTSPSNRVDLIARTIAILSHLHESNKRQKTECKELRKSLKKLKQFSSLDSSLDSSLEKSATKPSAANNQMSQICGSSQFGGNGMMMMMMPNMQQMNMPVGQIHQGTNQQQPMMMMVPMMMPPNGSLQGAMNQSFPPSMTPMNFTPMSQTNNAHAQPPQESQQSQQIQQQTSQQVQQQSQQQSSTSSTNTGYSSVVANSQPNSVMQMAWQMPSLSGSQAQDTTTTSMTLPRAQDSQQTNPYTPSTSMYSNTTASTNQTWNQAVASTQQHQVVQNGQGSALQQGSEQRNGENGTDSNGYSTFGCNLAHSA